MSRQHDLGLLEPSGRIVGVVRGVALRQEKDEFPQVRGWSTVELLAALINDRNLPGVSLQALAARTDGFGFLPVSCAVDELRADYGFSSEDALRLAVAFELGRRAAAPAAPAAIRGPADVSAIAERELSGLARETVLVIACDAANRPLRSIVVSRGACDSVPMPVREILHAVLRCDGRGFAVAHNHPAGHQDPSHADGVATERIAAASRTVGLRFLGHVVIPNGGAPRFLPERRELLVDESRHDGLRDGVALSPEIAEGGVGVVE